MFRRAVPVILGFLLGAIVTIVAIVVIAFVRFPGCGKDVRIAADIQLFGTLLKNYQTLNGSLPTAEQGLHALVEEPAGSPRPVHWRKLAELVPRDPWGTDYIYRCPGRKHTDDYDLFSAGPDRKPDTADDDWGEYGTR